MKKDAKNSMIMGKKSTTGITLVALVVTIVVLLILAGITITYVMGDNSIFKQAQNAKTQTEKAKAKERLETVFSSLHIEKYGQKLNIEDLDRRITEEINKMDGEEIGDDKKEVIVDGYRFQIDRTVPKIEEELGEADGIVITANVNGSDIWFKEGATIDVTVTGKIKTYSGGEITTLSATKGGEAISGFEIDNDGKYTISNITESTTIVINAEDSNHKTNTRTIPITIKIDSVLPTVDTVTASAKKMEITFSATGTDKESRIKQFNYSITPEDGFEAGEDKGTFKQGETVTILTKKETTYTISIIAEDYAGNKSEAKEKQVTTTDGLTVEEAKQLVTSMSAFKENIGKKVAYKSGETWQIFYYDEDGDFGPENTLYLKKQSAYPSDDERGPLTLSSKNAEDDPAVLMMKRMNPQWSDSYCSSSFDYSSEKGALWLCDPQIWNSKRNETYSSFAIGAPGIEMYVKAYNAWLETEGSEDRLVCEIGNKYGYYLGTNGIYSGDKCSTVVGDLQPGPLNMFSNYFWIASPTGLTNALESVWGTGLFYTQSGFKYIVSNGVTQNSYYAPIVPLDL